MKITRYVIATNLVMSHSALQLLHYILRVEISDEYCLSSLYPDLVMICFIEIIIRNGSNPHQVLSAIIVSIIVSSLSDVSQ